MLSTLRLRESFLPAENQKRNGVSVFLFPNPIKTPMQCSEGVPSSTKRQDSQCCVSAQSICPSTSFQRMPSLQKTRRLSIINHIQVDAV